ncbi:unnamed protein product [Phytophthora lilii]|uniref:Unnamed protein product n=1 Tax=Phytophthora lilii TaxID=2077276 RepID=A0A9W6U742_9STRA|nr:unnamed protein product [Phytophthora lilii]
MITFLSIYLASAIASASESTYEGDGGTGSESGSNNFFVGGANSAGDDLTLYLPAEALQNELLNTSGIEPNSLVAVSSNYSVIHENSPGLGNVAAPNTNVVRPFSSYHPLPTMLQ